MKSTLLRYIRPAIWLIFSIIICLGCSSTDVLRGDVSEPSGQALPTSMPVGRERAERLFRHVLQQQPQALSHYTRLVDAFKKIVDPYEVPFIPFATSRVIGDPLSLESLTHTLVCYDSLHPGKNRCPEGYISPEMVLREFVYSATEQLDVDQTIIRKTFQGASPHSLLDRLIAVVTDSNRLIKKAFSSISPDNRRRLLHMFPQLPDEFIMSDHISEADAIFMLDLAKKVDMAELFAGFSVLSTLVSPEFLAQLKLERADAHDWPLDRESYPGLKGRFLAVRETPAGLLVIGDEGPNIYGVDVSVIIDLGGDDIYLNNAGSPVYEIKDGHVESVDSHSSIIIDFAGNDRYLSSRFATIASGFFGVGLIVDMEGDDFYSGDRLSLGASFFGVGCLIDVAGNDTYTCQEMGQGSAFFGGALLLGRETISIEPDGSMGQATAQRTCTRPAHRVRHGGSGVMPVEASVYCMIFWEMISIRRETLPRGQATISDSGCYVMTEEMMSTEEAVTARDLLHTGQLALLWIFRATTSTPGGSQLIRGAHGISLWPASLITRATTPTGGRGFLWAQGPRTAWGFSTMEEERTGTGGTNNLSGTAVITPMAGGGMRAISACS